MLARHALARGLVYASDVPEGVAQHRRAIAEGEALLKRVPDHGFALNQVMIAKLELAEVLLRVDPIDAEGCRVLRAGLMMVDDLGARGRLPTDTAAYRSKYEALLDRCDDGR
jgi:hypothetical protein